MSNTSCPSDELLQRLVTGTLLGAELDEMIAHVDSCEDCQIAVERLDRQHPLNSLGDHTRADSLISKLHELRDHQPLDTTDTIARLLNARNVAIDEGVVETASQQAKSKPSFSVPSRIGPYVILRKLAQGGMGTVYAGRHVNLGRSIVVKLLGVDSRISRLQAEQVLREWRAHGRLSHPNIVAATDAGLIDGRPYLVTEMIEGLDLSKIVSTIGPLCLPEASAILRDAARGLAFAHSRGVAHLDIKPSNIMLDRSGTVKLLDLGTARLNGLPDTWPSTSVSDGADDLLDKGLCAVLDADLGADTFGTVGFLAPERARITNCPGDPSQSTLDGYRVDAFQADIYSLGCTWYYLLNGRAPFAPHPTSDRRPLSTSDMLAAHRDSPPPDIEWRESESASDQERQQAGGLLKSMLDKDPNQRCSSLQAIVSLSESLAEHSDLPALIANASVVKASDANGGDQAGVQQTSALSSGQTVQLSDLVQQSRSWRTYASVVLGSILLLVVVLSGLTVIKRSALEAPSKFGSQNPPQSTAGDAERIKSAGTWSWSPDQSKALLLNPSRLLNHEQRLDPTVATIKLESLVPRSRADQIEWSSNGRWLAILSERGVLRIYQWQDRELELLRYIQQSAEPIRRFAWHPDQPLIAIASGEHIATLSIDENPGWKPQPVPVSKVRRIEWTRDGKRALLLVCNDDGLLGWDIQRQRETRLLSDPRLLDIAPANHDHRLFTISTNGMAIYSLCHTGEGWSANLELKSSRRPVAEVGRVLWNHDDSLVAWSTLRAVSVYRTDTLEWLATVDLNRMLPNHGGFAWGQDATEGLERAAATNATWDAIPAELPLERPTAKARSDDLHSSSAPRIPERIVLLSEAANRLKRIEIQREPLGAASKYRSHVEISATTVGSGMAAVATATNPKHHVLAVCGPGNLEIWSQSFEPIVSLPGLAIPTSVIPMQLSDGVVVLNDDGQGTILNTAGDVVGAPIAPYHAYEFTIEPIRNQAVCESVDRLIQRPSSARLPMQVRSLRPYDPRPRIHDQFTGFLGPMRLEGVMEDHAQWPFHQLGQLEPLAIHVFPPAGTSHPSYYSYKHPDAIPIASYCIKPTTGRTLIAFTDGSYMTFLEGEPIQTGRIPGEGLDRLTQFGEQDNLLFTTATTDDGIEVLAFDLATESVRWTVSVADQGQLCGLSMLPNDRLLLSTSQRWLTLSGANGDQLQSVEPARRNGFSTDWVAPRGRDGKLYSRSRKPVIDPVACWSSDFDLQWICIGTRSGGQITLTADGSVVSQTRMEDFAFGEFQHYSRWFPGQRRSDVYSKKLTLPQEALCIVRYHADGGTSLTNRLSWGASDEAHADPIH